jgi:hypothetical protein
VILHRSTLRDTTCHEDVKYVLKFDCKTILGSRIRLFLCIFVFDCYEQKDLYKPMITPENGLLLLLLDYVMP